MTDLDGVLSYGLPHEQWYAKPDAKRELWVSYRSTDLTVQVGLTFREIDFRGHRETAVECRMFSDAWVLWTALPALFRALAAKPADTLADVTAVLDAFGGVDTTTREYPGKQGPALKAVREFERHMSPENARAAAELLAAYAGDPYEEVPF